MDKKKLDEQFDEIEKSLAGVQDSTAAVAKSVEDQTAHVKESLENMTGVLDGMKTNDDKREQELAGLKTDIENIKSMIPKVKTHTQHSILMVPQSSFAFYLIVADESVFVPSLSRLS